MKNDLDPEVWNLLFAPRSPAGGGVIGFRLCRIEEDREGFYLTGIGVGARYRWKPGRNVASCRLVRQRSGHQPPGRLCSCGLYACTDASALVRTLGPVYEQAVLCAVAGKGRVQIHERGWRAQYAEITAISAELPGRVIRDKGGRIIHMTRRRVVDSEILAAVGSCYGVPVVSLAQLEGTLKR